MDELRALTHRDGSPLVRVYGPRDRYDCGGTVAFNVLDRRGDVVPYEEVEARARDAGISVRGGCFCNPGASESGVRVRRRAGGEMSRGDEALGMERVATSRRG